MDAVFLRVLNMSLAASYVILFVVAARLLLRKAPKIFSYTLWVVVLFRLICPWSFESLFSLLPINPEPIPSNITYAEVPQINTGIGFVDQAVSPILSAQTAAQGASVAPLQVWVRLGGIIWLAGLAVLLIYSVISLLRLCSRLVGAVKWRDNIYLADHIASPFVMGALRPKIYLPSTLSKREQEYILLHEQTHIRRFDQIVKIVAFLALAIHWFNPLVWLAFFLCVKDMEMSCDEAVMKRMDTDIRREYSASLLSLATGRRIVAGIPLAFGEGDTKSRIKNVLNYKKPAFWVVAMAICTVVVLAVCLSANPKDNSAPLPLGSYIHEDESGIVSPAVTLLDNNKFTFVTSLSSSYLNYGTYRVWNDQLLLETDDGLYAYVFSIEDGTLVFQENASAKPPAQIADGDVFIRRDTIPGEGYDIYTIEGITVSVPKEYADLVVVDTEGNDEWMHEVIALYYKPAYDEHVYSGWMFSIRRCDYEQWLTMRNEASDGVYFQATDGENYYFYHQPTDVQWSSQEQFDEYSEICGSISVSYGQLQAIGGGALFSYSVSDIEKIEFQNGNTGELVSYANEREISDIVEHLNAFRYNNIAPVAGSGWTYAVRLWFKDASAMQRITLTPSSASIEGKHYISSEQEYFPQEWLEKYCLLQENASSPEAIVHAFFQAFENADYESMKQYCTQECVGTVFNADDVLGMKWAKALRIEASSAGVTEQDNETAVLVGVEMEIVSTEHALYGSDQTSFFIILARSEQGTWLIDRLVTG